MAWLVLRASAKPQDNKCAFGLACILTQARPRLVSISSRPHYDLCLVKPKHRLRLNCSCGHQRRVVILRWCHRKSRVDYLSLMQRFNYPAFFSDKITRDFNKTSLWVIKRNVRANNVKFKILVLYTHNAGNPTNPRSEF